MLKNDVRTKEQYRDLKTIVCLSNGWSTYWSRGCGQNRTFASLKRDLLCLPGLLTLQGCWGPNKVHYFERGLENGERSTNAWCYDWISETGDGWDHCVGVVLRCYPFAWQISILSISLSLSLPIAIFMSIYMSIHLSLYVYTLIRTYVFISGPILLAISVSTSTLEHTFIYMSISNLCLSI